MTVLRKLEAAYRRKVLGGMVCSAVVSCVTSNIISEQTVKVVTDSLIHLSPVESRLAATALGLAGSYKALGLILKRSLDIVGAKSPLEKRAYATEKLEDSLPSVVRVGFNVPATIETTRIAG